MLSLLNDVDLQGARPQLAGYIHLADRGDEARLRRPRALLRRSALRRRADGRRCCRAPMRRSGCKIDPRRPRLGRKCRRRAMSRGHVAGARRGAAVAVGEPRRCRATPRMSASSTGTATRSRRRRATARKAPVIPGLGLCPSSRGSQSWADPGHPSGVAPGKRPRLTPNPAIAMRKGECLMPFGTPGGDVQPQAMLQVFLNIMVFGMDIQQAVEAPRFATYSFPRQFRAAHLLSRPPRSRAGDRPADGRCAGRASATR